MPAAQAKAKKALNKVSSYSHRRRTFLARPVHTMQLRSKQRKLSIRVGVTCDVSKRCFGSRAVAGGAGVSKRCAGSTAGAGAERIEGGVGAERIEGGAGAERIEGAAGAERIEGTSACAFAWGHALRARVPPVSSASSSTLALPPFEESEPQAARSGVA